MIRQNRGAEGVEGEGYGKGMSPPHPTRGPGRDLKLPERVRKRFFLCILKLKSHLRHHCDSITYAKRYGWRTSFQTVTPMSL